MIEIVSATRHTEADFWAKSALGVSIRRLRSDDRVQANIRFRNSAGLADVYNARLLAHDGPEALVFVHDDVWIDDFFLVDRVLAGLEDRHVIGLAGNRRRVDGQPSWSFVDDGFTWDEPENLSGSVAHGKYPFGQVSRFGPVPADCELLDGVFLAVQRSALREEDVAFDPRFRFHFYDMDFCRSARSRQLRLGTWPICVTHQSGGSFGTPEWRRLYAEYLSKWGS